MNLELQKVGVIGAGAMGRGIAQVCAAAGCSVQLFDSATDAVTRALEAVRTDLALAVRKGKLAQDEADATLARIQPLDDLHGLRDCEIVVEAIVEKLEPKQSLMRELEAIVSPDCILATNTSSLSVTAIAAACEKPFRVAGWHFFNPVPRMRLVEIIQAPRTAAEVVQALAALSQRIGHRAVVASDSPGFVVNHAGRAFVTEGLKLLAERVADHQVVDAILRNAGFRMGPFELLDLTGLDVSVPVMESIHAQYYGDDRYRPVALARTRMVAGLLGRKTGQGFYTYKAGTQQQPPAQPAAPAVQATLWWPDTGPGALPASLASLLPADARRMDPKEADVLLLAPLGRDLSTTVADLALDPTKAIAIDPLFGGASGVTLMASPATDDATVKRAQGIFARLGIASFVIADSPGYVAPRLIACIVNLACEMAQQGIAAPADIDQAARLGLGYPAGPFEWGDRLGAPRVLEVLNGLYACFGDQRYRPSAWLVRRARLGLPLLTLDRR